MGGRCQGAVLGIQYFLSKVVQAFLHKTLYMSAMVTLYQTAWGQRFCEHLAAAGKPPKLIIVAMMRQLVHVAFGVFKSGKRFNPAMMEPLPTYPAQA